MRIENSLLKVKQKHKQFIYLNLWLMYNSESCVLFSLHHEGQFGTPTVSSAMFVGMAAVTMTSIVESIGDYYMTARICNVPAPPKHAMNRGIAMEGVGSVLSGLMGACHATTSYSQNVAFVNITKVTP